MKVRAFAASGLLVGAVSLALAVASPASAVCDSYSGGCPTTPPGGGGGNTDIGGNDEDPATDDTDDADSDDDTGTDEDDAPDNSTVVNNRTTPNTPSTLPFTGGEVVMLTALGAGALVGGTALVVAGRRKSSPAA